MCRIPTSGLILNLRAMRLTYKDIGITVLTDFSSLCSHTELKLRIWFGNYMEKIRPVLKLLWSLDVRNMDL